MSLGFKEPYDDKRFSIITQMYIVVLVPSPQTQPQAFLLKVFGDTKKNCFLLRDFAWRKNSSYGDNTGWYKTPRVGLTYIISAGKFTFKPRASWGKSTQAIPELYKLGRTVTSGNYTLIYLPNPDLVPQTQQGYELGTDVFFANNYSFGITYYNQTVGNLIQKVDYSSDDLYTSISKYVNVADVFNHGIELNAKAIFNDFHYKYIRNNS